MRRFLRSTLAIASAFPPGSLLHADTVRNAEWFLDYLQIAKVHKISTGAGITVALADTGTYPHRDFINNIITGVDLISGIKGGEKIDKDGHGTEMAGLIAGHGHDSAAGVIGIAPQSRILPVKVAEASSRPSKLAIGIERSATLGAEVINVSAGTAPSKELLDAVSTAAQNDSVIIASSGNEFNASQIAYPAALSGVLAVGAIDQEGNIAHFSTSGKNLGICAPGVDIVTTALDNKYSKVQGTSAATAIASGAAALVRARFPELSAPEVIHRLTATATDIGPPGRDDQCGYGVLNIVKALTADVPPLDGGKGAGASSGVGASGPRENGGGWTTGLFGGIAAVLGGGVLVALLAARRRNRKQL